MSLARHVVLAENVFDDTDKLWVFDDSTRVKRVVPDHDLAHGVVLQLHVVVTVERVAELAARLAQNRRRL